EEGRGGWFSDLVGLGLGMAREDATDWIADRIGMAALPRPARQRSTPGATPANDPGEPPSALAAAPPPESNSDDDAPPAPRRAHGREPPPRRAAARRRWPPAQCRDHRARWGQAFPRRWREEGSFRGGGRRAGAAPGACWPRPDLRRLGHRREPVHGDRAQGR